MVLVAPIKLQYNPKTLWFDANGLDIHKGDAVVVTTARGLEFGHAAEEIIEVDETEIKKLKSELKPVERLATPEDEEKSEEMRTRSAEALPIFKEMAAETSDDMHPVSVEFLLDGDKAIFYFEAEERVDFRELVRKLAAKFHVRIDMRQIGVRDEARIVGGLGHCGQELCCRRLGGEFNPVSIRMAKDQDLSLNPQKISGVCGRLMCCLRYEFDTYKEFKERAPKMNAKIETPEGIAKVVDLNVPREIITIQLEDDKRIKVPLNEMEPAEKGGRPSKISKQAFERFANQNIFDTFDSIDMPHFGETPIFSEESVSDNKKGKEKNSGRKNDKNDRVQPGESSRKPRRRTRMNKEGQPETEQASGNKSAQSEQSGQAKQRSGQKPRRQNTQSSKGQGDNQGKGHTEQSNNRRGQANKRSDDNQGQKKQALRPGQKSSGLRTGSSSSGKTNQSGSSSLSNASNDAGSSVEHRKTRRRSHKADTSITGTGDTHES